MLQHIGSFLLLFQFLKLLPGDCSTVVDPPERCQEVPEALQIIHMPRIAGRVVKEVYAEGISRKDVCGKGEAIPA